jgi:phosphohistidine phosphatase SixA
MSTAHVKKALALFIGAACLFVLTHQIWSGIRHSAGAAAPTETSSVILVRHGDAPGTREPSGFDLNNCKTQRNLSSKGLLDALGIGTMFRERGIKVVKILSSRFCRAQETATLMLLGLVETSAAFDDLAFNKPREREMLERERKTITSWHGPGLLLVVTHGSNIEALAGAKLKPGAMIAVHEKDKQILATPFGLADQLAGRSYSDIAN